MAVAAPLEAVVPAGVRKLAGTRQVTLLEVPPDVAERLELAAAGMRITLADLDVVKPYFRSRSARAILSDAGIELLAPTGANVHADLPIIVPQIRSALREPGRRVIVDVGGDSTGARVLGSVADVMPVDETESGLVNSVLHNGARLYVDHAHPEQAVHPVDFILSIPGCFVVIGLVILKVDGAVGHIEVPTEDQRFLPL